LLEKRIFLWGNAEFYGSIARQIAKNAVEITIKTGNCFKSGLGFDII